jgi:hypothetical protein
MRFAFKMIFIALSIGLLTSNAYFYQQSRRYSKINRKLILQNDSIMSVNLELLQERGKPGSTSMIERQN